MSLIGVNVLWARRDFGFYFDPHGLITDRTLDKPEVLYPETNVQKCSLRTSAIENRCHTWKTNNMLIIFWLMLHHSKNQSHSQSSQIKRRYGIKELNEFSKNKLMLVYYREVAVFCFCFLFGIFSSRSRVLSHMETMSPLLVKDCKT